MPDVNYLAILVGGLISMGLGTLWYGPLFGKPWMELSGISKGAMDAKAKKSMMKAYLLMFAGALVMAYVLSHIVLFSAVFYGITGLMIGLQSALWVWLGFVAPVMMGGVLWEGKSWKLWFINSGYYLVYLLIIGALLALWV